MSFIFGTSRPVSLYANFDTSEDITSIAFSADGTRAITGTGFFGRVILWDVATGKEIRRFAYADYGPVISVAFGPGDTTVLASGLADLYLWDVETGASSAVTRVSLHFHTVWPSAQMASMSYLAL